MSLLALILPVGRVPICHSHIPLVILSQKSLNCNNRVSFAIVNQPVFLERCGPSVLVTCESKTRWVTQSMVTAQGPNTRCGPSVLVTCDSKTRWVPQSMVTAQVPNKRCFQLTFSHEITLWTLSLVCNVTLKMATTVILDVIPCNRNCDPSYVILLTAEIQQICFMKTFLARIYSF